ncbi:hypothetical protein [Ezakiella peruensis]|uniref:hypothetical protein n=1 Tax=Ezakiella peruensis TaxID=1464038 RepID=UPI000C1B2AB0|nr:hypothetical protein [Ezakiella peruensis]
MLTYKELQEILEKYDLYIQRLDYDYAICDKDKNIIATVSRKDKSKFKVSFSFSNYAKEWSMDDTEEIAWAISQFACSPIDERDIQQNYYIRNFKTGNYLKRIPTPRGGHTFIKYTSERDIFTEEEAEKIEEEFSAKLEKIKVQDDIGLITKWRKLYMVTADTYDGDYDDHGAEICFFGVYGTEKMARERVEFLKGIGHRYAKYREVRLNANEYEYLGGYIDD